MVKDISMENNTCCEKCDGITPKGDGYPKLMTHICLFKSCPCHQVKREEDTQEWEEELREMLGEIRQGLKDDVCVYELMRKTLLSQKQQLENDYELKIPIYSKEIMEQARQDERMKTIRRMTAYKEGRQQLYKELREIIEKRDWECFEQIQIKKDILDDIKNILEERE